MRLLCKQRLFSWFDSYDIYDEGGQSVFSVEGQLSWEHKLHILDSQGNHIGTVQEELFHLLPRFRLYAGGFYIGSIAREFSFFKPVYRIDCKGWQITGNFPEWDYTIRDANGQQVAVITKELLHLTDTYIIDVADPQNALYVLMFTLAMDAEKCSRN